MFSQIIIKIKRLDYSLHAGFHVFDFGNVFFTSHRYFCFIKIGTHYDAQVRLNSLSRSGCSSTPVLRYRLLSAGITSMCHLGPVGTFKLYKKINLLTAT